MSVMMGDSYQRCGFDIRKRSLFLYRSRKLKQSGDGKYSLYMSNSVFFCLVIAVIKVPSAILHGFSRVMILVMRKILESKLTFRVYIYRVL